MWGWSEVKEQFEAIAPKLKAASWPALFTSMAAGAHYTEGILPEHLGWAIPLAAVATHFFVVLSAHRAEEAVSTLATDSSNHDLDKAFAEALRGTLQAAGQRIGKERPLESADLSAWFILWDQRLERGLATPEDASLLFYSENPPDPTKAGMNLWPAFEEDLLRWAREQKEFDPACTLDLSSLPAPLRDSLATLPEETYVALRHAVRKEELARAWIAWTQRFQEEEYRLLNVVLAQVLDMRETETKLIPQLLKEVQELRKSLDAARALQPAPAPHDDKRYLHWLRDDTHFIGIRGLKVAGGAVRRLEITQLYTPLTTLMAPRQPEEGAQRGDMDSRRPVPLQGVLDRYRLVLIGAPGGGKSTFLKRIAFAACETLLGYDKNAAGEMFPAGTCPFPILISAASLEKYVRESVPPAGGIADPSSPAWVIRYLAARSDSDEWNLDGGFFREKLREGCLLLIDGLDEVPSRSRRQFSRFLEYLGAAYPQTQLVATSRPAAYGGETALPAFEDFEIQDLDEKGVETFVANWCRLLGTSEREARQHQESLLREIRAQPEIVKLAVNPVMLTALASLHWNGKKLPAQRSELYDSILGWLAEARQEQSERPALVLLRRMQRIATAMHVDERGKQVECTRDEAADSIQDEFSGNTKLIRHAGAVEFLREEETYSGILVDTGDLVRFWHQTFQEALAGIELAGDDDAREQHLFRAGKLHLPECRETVLLMSGQLCKQSPKRVEAFLKRVLKPLNARSKLAKRAQVVGLVGLILRDLEAWNYDFKDSNYQDNLDQCLGIFDPAQAYAIPFETRLEAAEALGKAGDPRIRKNNWVRMTGPFLLGEPRREVTLPPFEIGRYPVTVAEYKTFVEDDGYLNKQWWQAGGFGEEKSPEDWEPQLEHPNRPVVSVTWYEAAAYCAWAGGRLPMGEEWEGAARGGEGREYPWGAPEPDETRANYYQNGPKHPTPVGLYPAGGTPEGIQDLAGNVWEWTADWYDAEKEYRVLRGGSWFNHAAALRAAGRGRDLPGSRYVIIGFRCVREV